MLERGGAAERDGAADSAEVVNSCEWNVNDHTVRPVVSLRLVHVRIL